MMQLNEVPFEMHVINLSIVYSLDLFFHFLVQEVAYPIVIYDMTD